MSTRDDKQKHPPVGIDESAQPTAAGNVPYNEIAFAQIRVTDTWAKYAGRLSWGKGQCLAILDDGCDMTFPQWQTQLPWGPKVIATYNAIDDNDDPTPVPPGYHGTSVGFPSSQYCDGVLGVAYHNHVAQVRCVSIVHLPEPEVETINRAFDWVLAHHKRLNITAVNFSALDDLQHQQPMPTDIDTRLESLRAANIWVSSPCGNHNYTDGISWPACQPLMFGIGATVPGEHKAHLDRFSNTDLLVTASATSSSNAYAAACAMILREAIESTRYDWQALAPNMPDAIMNIFLDTGNTISDPHTGLTFKELDLLAAVDHVFQ